MVGLGFGWRDRTGHRERQREGFKEKENEVPKSKARTRQHQTNPPKVEARPMLSKNVVVGE